MILWAWPRCRIKYRESDWSPTRATQSTLMKLCVIDLKYVVGWADQTPLEVQSIDAVRQA